MVFLFDVLRTDIQMNNRANQTIMRNILIILIVISELTFFSSCKKKEGPPLYGYIRISVIDTLTGLPIKDAIINSSPSGIDNEKTNTNGVLFSGKLDKDNYDISISIHGYISQIKKSVKILVEDKDTVKLNISLKIVRFINPLNYTLLSNIADKKKNINVVLV